MGENHNKLKKESEKLTNRYADPNADIYDEPFDNFGVEQQFQEQSLKRTFEEKAKMQLSEEHQMSEKEVEIIRENNSLIKQIQLSRNHLAELKFLHHEKLLEAQCPEHEEEFQEIKLDDIKMSSQFSFESKS